MNLSGSLQALGLVGSISLQQTGFTFTAVSPPRTVGSYPTRFTFALAGAGVVSFLWHFP